MKSDFVTVMLLCLAKRESLAADILTYQNRYETHGEIADCSRACCLRAETMRRSCTLACRSDHLHVFELKKTACLGYLTERRGFFLQ